MEFLDELIRKRITTVEASIVADEFADRDAFDAEIARLVNVMTSTAVINHISREDARAYLQEHFVEVINKKYEDSLKAPDLDMPEDYAFAEQQAEIEALIAEGNLEEADKKIEDLRSILEDEEMVKDSIDGDVFTQADVDYFMNVAYPHFQELKDEKIADMPEDLNFFQRVGRGIKFVFTGSNPYDNKKVKVKKEKEKSEEDSKARQLIEWAKKNKGKLTALGLAAVLAGGIFIGAHLHNKAKEADKTTTTGAEDSVDDNVVMATFEVDENHNFNINDQETHITQLELLSKAFMDRGVRVVSAEECVALSNQGILAVTPEQLDNWLISINLQDIDDLTFTKLLADSDTDKEELSSDFLRVSNILGTIYTTKEENPFIYQFIASKESSAYIKAYEEAIIQNQKGDQQALVGLIRSRVENAVSAKSSGPMGMLSTSLIYQQANVYNARVIGQDIMDLYNINNDCKTDTTTTFYSDDWAEFTRKLDSKFEAAIKYTGSETMAYIEYFKTLTDAQNDNKVFVENQVLPFLEMNNIQLGEWDLIDEIANDRYVAYQGTKSTGGTTQTVTNPAEVEAIKVIPKEPTTPAELAVQQETEKKLDEQNQQNFQDTVNEFAKENGGITQTTQDGDMIIYIPGQEPIVVDGSTMGAYDATKDYQGTTYTGYDDYKDQHRTQVEDVTGVGQVVVTDESHITVTNPNVYQDRNGNIIDRVTGDRVITGTQEEIQDIINRHPEITQWTTVDEGEIHYSDVDNTLPQTTYGGSTYTTTPESTYSSTSGTYSQSQTVTQPETTTPSSTIQSQTPIYEDENVKVTVNNPVQIQTSTQNPEQSVLDSVDQDILSGLTAEEQRELEEMLNAGNTPVAGEIVSETFSDVVYGNYTVPQLMNNPALCKNVPESILRNDFPEIWNVYQNWLAEQAQIAAQAEVAAQNTQEEQVVMTADTQQTDIAAQIAALEAEKAGLTGEGLSAGDEGKTLS